MNHPQHKSSLILSTDAMHAERLGLVELINEIFKRETDIFYLRTGVSSKEACKTQSVSFSV